MVSANAYLGAEATADALLALACAPPGLALAQAFPARPITFIVPFAAGSATDPLARTLGQSLTEQTTQTVVVDNKAGASGMLAAQAAARVPADGHTLPITTNTTHAANEHLYRKLPHDPVKDFAPVTGLGKGGQVLVVNAGSPHKSVAGELFQQMSRTEILHVPYKSNPLAFTDLLGGQIDMMITDTSTGVPQIRAGKLRALGVSTARRLSMLPEEPTIAEAGMPGRDMGYWFAAYVPAGTPAPVVQRLNELLARGPKSAAIKTFIDTSGGEPFATTPEALAAFQTAEARKWGKGIKAAGIEPE